MRSSDRCVAIVLKQGCLLVTFFPWYRLEDCRIHYNIADKFYEDPKDKAGSRRWSRFSKAAGSISPYFLFVGRLES